jgi:hypothetical protein
MLLLLQFSWWAWLMVWNTGAAKNQKRGKLLSAQMKKNRSF